MAFTSSFALTLAISSICNQNAGAFLSPSPACFHSSASNQQRRFATPARHRQKCHRQRGNFQLFSTTDTDLEQEISSMRVASIKQELESYGISTRTFLEKGELVEALIQARKEGKTPTTTASSASSSSSEPASSGNASSSSGAAASPGSGGTTSTTATTTASSADRKERIRAELDKCKSLKVSELKSELESYGVSTRTFFEKSEFERALAEARADGAKKSKKKKRRSSATAAGDGEVEEVAAKAELITDDSVGPKTKKSGDSGGGSAAAGDPFGGAGAGGNPFGGGGGGMGGMDMGNIADMLKGMGGMGGGGASPFGGAAGGGGAGAAGGANPFGGAGMGDAMKAAQQAMSNPKVMAVVQKAQKNPRVMAAVQECMGNPMAMSKYMSDPEVGPILKELQDAMM